MNFPTLLIAKCDRFVKSVRYCVLQSLSKLHLSTCCFVTEQGQSIGGLLCYHLRIHLKQLLSWSFHRPTFSQHHLIHLFLLEVFHRLFYLPVLCEVRRDVLFRLVISASIGSRAALQELSASFKTCFTSLWSTFRTKLNISGISP